MSATSGSWNEPVLPPLVTIVGAAGDGRSWMAAVTTLIKSSWRTAGPLIAASAVAALPAAGAIGLTARAFEARSGHCCTGQTQPVGIALTVVLGGPVLLALVVTGGYWIARWWTEATWVIAAIAADKPQNYDSGYSAAKRSRYALWRAYLAGVAVLCVLAGYAGDVLTNDHLVRDFLITVGPLGLMAPLMIFVPRWIYATSARTVRGARHRYLRMTCLTVVFELVAGVASALLVNAGGILILAGAVLAFVLTVSSVFVLSAASYVTYGALVNVASAQSQPAEDERAGGPEGDDAEGGPGGERQAAESGRGQDVLPGQQRADLFQVPDRRLVAHDGDQHREQEQQPEHHPGGHRRIAHHRGHAKGEHRDQRQIDH
jgi:hypothetical protein